MSGIELWKDREKRLLDPTLFSTKAEKLAKELGEQGKQGKEKNKNTQVRRYFDEVVRLNGLAATEDGPMAQILPQLHMLIAKVVYAQGRDLVTHSFVEMMKSGIEQVETREDLQAFTNFLESFMGYYKVYGPK